MQEYRLYFVDPSDRIDDAMELYCSGDAEAIRQASKHADGRHRLELWTGMKKVVALDPASVAPSA